VRRPGGAVHHRPGWDGTNGAEEGTIGPNRPSRPVEWNRDMPEISVRHEHGRRFRAQAGSHQLVVDLPVESGGEDAGPSPIELFVAGLATGAAMEAGAYLQSRDLPLEGVSVACSYRLDPAESDRLQSVDLTVCVPYALDHQHRGAVAAAAGRCPARAALERPPLVGVMVAACQPGG